MADTGVMTAVLADGGVAEDADETAEDVDIDETI